MKHWWAGRGLTVESDGLRMNGESVAELAARYGTPLYIYSSALVRERLALLRSTLAGAGVRSKIYYAMKSNRSEGVLRTVRAEGDIGIDACSPREVERALQMGFQPGEVSVTASMLSNRDLDRLAAHGVHINLDSLSALRRYGERVPAGTRVGLRLNPGVAAGYGGQTKTAYGNAKFGFYEDGFDGALEGARAAGLVVDTLHIHCGWGLQMQDAAAVEEAFVRLAAFARRVPGLEVVNLGGGLGARNREADQPLAVEVWGELIRRYIAPLGLTVACEPGTFAVADAGILVVEVNTVEEKGGVLWAGVDAGHNINVYPYHYDIPLELVHVGRPDERPTRLYTIAGNINEAGDLFARALPLPELREGDLLAMLPAGAYGASMASDHCMRGGPAEITI